MSERLKYIKDTLMSAVESQMYNLEEVDTEELGDVIDMIKDLEEAAYYCAVVEAMEESKENGKYENPEMMYYTPYHGRMYYGGGRGDYSSHRETNNTDGRDNRRHYDDKMYYSDGDNGNSSQSSSNGTNNGSNTSYYTEREYPNAFQDEREGRSYRSRRMYMESKESKQDKSVQMKELEKYAQELTSDIIEMVQGSSQEEKQYLSKKISALANKITQLNDPH